jgi:hypothetical protein
MNKAFRTLSVTHSRWPSRALSSRNPTPLSMHLRERLSYRDWRCLSLQAV